MSKPSGEDARPRPQHCSITSLKRQFYPLGPVSTSTSPISYQKCPKKLANCSVVSRASAANARGHAKPTPARRQVFGKDVDNVDKWGCSSLAFSVPSTDPARVLPTPLSGHAPTSTARVSMSPTTASIGYDGGGGACSDVVATRPSAAVCSDIEIDRGAGFFCRTQAACVDGQTDTPCWQPGCKNDHPSDPGLLSSFSYGQNRRHSCLDPPHVSAVATTIISESSNTDLTGSFSTPRRGSFWHELGRQHQIVQSEESLAECNLCEESEKSVGFWDYQRPRSEPMAGEGRREAVAVEEVDASTKPIAHSGKGASSSLNRHELMRWDSPTPHQTPVPPPELKLTTELSSVSSATHVPCSGLNGAVEDSPWFSSGDAVGDGGVLNTSSTAWPCDGSEKSCAPTTHGAAERQEGGTRYGSQYGKGRNHSLSSTEDTLTPHCVWGVNDGEEGMADETTTHGAAERQESGTRYSGQYGKGRNYSLSSTEDTLTPHFVWGVNDGGEGMADATTPQFNSRVFCFRKDDSSLMQMGSSSHVEESRQRRGRLDAALHHHPSFTGSHGETKGPVASLIPKVQGMPKLGTPRLRATVKEGRHRSTQPNRNGSGAHNSTNRVRSNSGSDICLSTSTGNKVSPDQVSNDVPQIKSSTSILLKLFPRAPDTLGDQHSTDLSVDLPHEFGLWKRTEKGPPSSPTNENEGKSELSPATLSDTRDRAFNGEDFPISSQRLNLPKDRHSVNADGRGHGRSGGGGVRHDGNRGQDPREVLFSLRPSSTISTGAAVRTALLSPAEEQRGVGGNYFDSRSGRAGGVAGEANISHHSSLGSSSSDASRCNLRSTEVQALSFGARNSSESYQSDDCRDSIRDIFTNQRTSFTQAQTSRQHASQISPRVSPTVARVTTRPRAYAPACTESGWAKCMATTLEGLKPSPPRSTRSSITSMGRVRSEAQVSAVTAGNQGDLGNNRGSHSNWGSSAGDRDTIWSSRPLQAPTKAMIQGPPPARRAVDTGANDEPALSNDIVRNYGLAKVRPKSTPGTAGRCGSATSKYPIPCTHPGVGHVVNVLVNSGVCDGLLGAPGCADEGGEEEDIHMSHAHQLSGQVVNAASITPVIPDEYESDEQTADHSRENLGGPSQREGCPRDDSYVDDSSCAANNTSHTDLSRHGQSITWKRGEQIGTGSFGKVFKGLNEATGELFAVKQIKLTGGSKEETLALESEIRVMKDLHHRHIVRYCGMNRGSRHLYIFLEYITGGSIASMLQQFGVFAENLVRRLIHQILLGVRYLHDKGIIHRDIKGGNVLVTEQGIAKLADFGCSKQLHRAQTQTFDDDLDMLQGSIPWMAPEVIKQTKHGCSADVWSIGATMIEMCTARYPWPPFSNKMAAMYHVAVATEPPAFPEHISSSAREFLSRCLIIAPEKRLRTSELLQHCFVRGAAEELRATSGQGPGGLGVSAVMEEVFST